MTRLSISPILLVIGGPNAGKGWYILVMLWPGCIDLESKKNRTLEDKKSHCHKNIYVCIYIYLHSMWNILKIHTCFVYHSEKWDPFGGGSTNSSSIIYAPPKIMFWKMTIHFSKLSFLTWSLFGMFISVFFWNIWGMYIQDGPLLATNSVITSINGRK